MMRKVRLNKPTGFAHVNFFIKMTMKKCILNIQLSYRPIKGRAKERAKRIVGGLTMGLKVSW